MITAPIMKELNSQEPNTLKIGDLHIDNSLSEKVLT